VEDAVVLNLIATSLLASILSAGQPATQPERAAGELGVMTFNIRYGTADDGDDRWSKRCELVFDVIRRQRPDVIGLQEALRFQLDEIRAALPGYAELGVGREDGKKKGEYSAILYREERLRPVESGTFWFSDTPEVVGSITWGNKLARVCTWARFEDRAGGGAFLFFNLHIDHQSQPSRERSTELLARRIAERKPTDVPVIVTGDFNAGEANPAVRYLVEGAGFRVQGSANTETRPSDEVQAASRPAGVESPRLVDTFRALHPEAKIVGTFNGFKGTTTGEKIDYILVTPGVTPLAAEILKDSRDGRYPSDHFPVVAKVRLPDRQPTSRPG
jgi:endonuclease/exonuclease/phosphatase family metal-dependent hydrolase